MIGKNNVFAALFMIILFILVGCPHDTESEEEEDTDIVYVIPNDISWEIIANTPFENYTVDPIIFGNGKFIASAYTYDNECNNFLSKIAYSTDGKTWNLSQFDDDYLLIYDISYGNEKYVAVCYDGKIGNSTNGINWIFQKINVFGEENVYSIAFGKGLFVAGAGNGIMAYSYDSTNWNLIQNKPFGNSMIYHIAYGNNIFVVGTQDGKLGYSVNGIDWTILPERIFGNSSIFELKYVNDRFIASSGHDIAFSKNGISWEKQTVDIINNSYFIQAIAYGENMFLFGTGNGNIAFSHDLIDWKKVTDTKFGTDEPGKLDPINYIIDGNNRIVIEGKNGKIVNSIN
jgi:hypothetical protein